MLWTHIRLQEAVIIFTRDTSLDCDNLDDLCKQYGKKGVKNGNSELESEFNPNLCNK
jgi:hypothetical protein